MRPFLDSIAHKGHHISAKLNAYDIVCIQEGFDGKDLLKAKAKHKEKIAPGTKRNLLTWVDSGLLTFGNYELLAHHFEVYRDAATFQDIIASKGVLMTRWKIGTGIVDIYNTHLQAGGGSAGHDASRGQIQQLVKFVQSHTPPENALIVVGDFNMGPHRPGRDHLDMLPHPRYCSNEEMLHKTASFQILLESLNLLDFEDQFHVELLDWFDRCLFRPGTKTKLIPYSLLWDRKTMFDPDGEALSDSHPILFTFDIGEY